MKKIILIVWLLQITAVSTSQTWAWASATTGTSTAIVSTVCNDPAGNAFVCGYYYGSSITFGTYTLSNPGSALKASMYLVKYNAAGTVLWAQTFGGNTGDDLLRSACTDALGNIYVCGTIGSAAVNIGSLSVAGNGGGDLFVAKFNTNGNAIWAKIYGGNNVDEATGICLDSSGNPCISANFSSSQIVIGTNTLNCNAAESCLLAKFDTSGNLIWVKKPSGSFDDQAWGIAADGNGNLFLAGDFNSPSLSFGNSTLTLSSSRNIFLAKYDASGNALWARSSSGSGNAYARAIAADGLGDVYTLGHFIGPIVALGSFSFSNSGQEDGLIAKYSNAGNFIWAKTAAGVGRDIGHSISITANEIYLTGSLGSFAYSASQAINIGTVVIIPPPASTDAMYFARLDLNGVVQSYTALASGGNNHSSVCFDNVCHTYIASDYHNINGVPLSFGSTTLNYSVYQNVFLARLDKNCETIGLADIKPQNPGVLLYPNPNNGNFIVLLNQHVNHGLMVLSNMMGQQVVEQMLTEGQNFVNTAGLPTGIYQITIFEDGLRLYAGKLSVR